MTACAEPPVKERPILFSGPMVRAIREKRKTQTRRVGKIQCAEWVELGCESSNHATKGKTIIATHLAYPNGGTARHGICEFPYGYIGDRLWVREEHFRFGHWEMVPGVQTKGGRQKWKFVADDGFVRFPDEADAPKGFRKGRQAKDPATPAWHKRLARFMPRKFSRITLEITNVRVERLQEISDDDCAAEGCCDHTPLQDSEPAGRFIGDRHHLSAVRLRYECLWESINGKGSWALNPWVWVVEFKDVSEKAVAA